MFLKKENKKENDNDNDLSKMSLFYLKNCGTRTTFHQIKKKNYTKNWRSKIAFILSNYTCILGCLGSWEKKKTKLR